MNITTIIISLIAVLSVILLFYVFKESTKRQDEINRLTSEKAASVASQEQLNAQLEQKKTEIADMQQKLERNNRDIADTLAEKARLEEQIRMINEKQKELEEKTKLEFQNLSNSILKEQTEIFKQNNEKGLNEILNPVKDKLDSFKKAMTDYNNTQISYASALNQQIKDLSQVNSSIGKEAQELTNALRNNGKVQGDWGEHVLKRILDISGLKEGLHYTTQETRQSDGTVIRNDNGGMLRPDVILFMPDGKRLIVDSKVSLTAYTEYINADDDKERAEALRRHVDLGAQAH
jgi:DNA recombination protein RmuC